MKRIILESEICTHDHDCKIIKNALLKAISPGWFGCYLFYPENVKYKITFEDSETVSSYPREEFYWVNFMNDSVIDYIKEKKYNSIILTIDEEILPSNIDLVTWKVSSFISGWKLCFNQTHLDKDLGLETCNCKY